MSKQREANFKLWVCDLDDACANFDSWDWKNPKITPRLGMKYLLRFVENRKAHIKTARIYDKRYGNDTLIGIYQNGCWEPNPENYI